MSWMMMIRKALGLRTTAPPPQTPEHVKEAVRRQLREQAEVVKMLNAQVDGVRPPRVMNRDH